MGKFSSCTMLKQLAYQKFRFPSKGRVDQRPLRLTADCKMILWVWLPYDFWSKTRDGDETSGISKKKILNQKKKRRRYLDELNGENRNEDFLAKSIIMKITKNVKLYKWPKEQLVKRDKIPQPTQSSTKRRRKRWVRKFGQE